MPKKFYSESVKQKASNNNTIPSSADLSASRAGIVNELWHALNGGADAPSSEATRIIDNFEEERCPQVARGEISGSEMEAQVIAAMVDGSSGEISKESFFNWHADFLRETPNQTDREVTLLLRMLWRQDQPDQRFRNTKKAELVKANAELFRSSAYRGQVFQEQPMVDDKVETAQGSESMSKLVPFAMPKYGQLPHELEGHFYSGAPMEHHKTRCLRNGDEIVNNQPPFEGEAHKSGAVASNPKSLGFLDSSSNNKEYGGGQLDDNVVNAIEDGKRKEQEAARRRMEVLSQPFSTAEPPHFKSTQQLEHLDYSGVIDRSRAVLSSDREYQKGPGDIRGNRGLRPAGDGHTAPDALPDELAAAEKELAASNRRKAHPPPRFDDSTTQRESFAPLAFNDALISNDRWNEQPTMHASQVKLANASQKLPRFEREYGSLETEYSKNMQNPGPNKDFSTKHHHPNVLDLKNGTNQMKGKWHHPRQAPLGDSVPELAASNVAPRQFATTSKHFFEGKKY